MKKFLLTLIALFSILFLKVELAQAQVDNLHYIPPMCSFTNDPSNVYDHQMVLTTSETTPFDVTIRNKDETFTKTVSLSASDPKKISLNYSIYTLSTPKQGYGTGSQGIIGTDSLNLVLKTEGLIVSGPKKFFVSIQQQSDAQGDLLTSKGTTGLGTDFYSGHMYSVTSSYDRYNGHFIGVMATENNTNVTFSNPRVIFTGRTSNTFTIPLKKDQSVVIGISYNDMLANSYDLNDVNGTHITSNKPIAVSSGSMCASGSTGGGRDVGFDQLVPTDVVGKEYILIKGEGSSIKGGKPWAKQNERATIVATENNTEINYYYKNKDTNSDITKTVHLNKGEYFTTGEDEMVYSKFENMYIKANEKIFVYQTLSGSNKRQTAGFCFIPPLKCTADKEVTIAYADKLSTLTVSPILKLVTQVNSTVTINGDIISRDNTTGFNNVVGNTYWETYDIPKSELSNHLDSNDEYNFEVVSTGALNAMLAFESGNVGGGGFFSGFGDVPQVNQSPYLTDQGLCGGNVILTATGFTSYNWYKDEILVSSNDDATYQPTEPGRYKVTGISPCDGSTTESYPSSEIIIYPCLSVSDVSVTEGTDLNAVVRVELSHTWSTTDEIDVTFDYETNSGTATSGLDYTPKNGSATIPSGSSYVDISVPITDDLLNEDDEEFTFTISNVVEAVENITVGTVTILDDNDPMPTITVSNQTVNEDAGTVSLTVSLNTVSGKTITADYSISDNTATQISDYTASASGTLTFDPSNSNTLENRSQTISLNIIDDAIYEPGTDEFFTIQLSNIVNATEGDASADISITDNDSKPEITVNDASGNEGESIVFQANLDHAADVDITFEYEIDVDTGKGNGYAKDKDFIGYSSFLTGTITIPAGETSVYFPSFTTEDDNANEGAENFTLNFSAATNATLGNTSAIGTIIDNEGDPTLSIEDATTTEGGILSFIISVSPIKSSDIVFEYRTIDGSASSSADFTGADWTSITLPANSLSMTLSIATAQDTDEEGTEKFTVEIGNPPSGVDLAAGLETATGTIIDDDDKPIAKPDSCSVNEDASLIANVMGNDLGKGDNPVVSSNTSPDHGSLAINSNGSFEYTPYANYNGSDSFKYTIEDDDGDLSSAEVTITVNPVNDLPDAIDDTYTTPEDTQLNNNVTTNDQNLFDLPITVTLVTKVSNGALTLNADGTFSYMPASNYFGTDDFIYQLTDGTGDVVQAKVTINITSISDGPPVAVDDNVSTKEDTPYTIDVLDNDTDPDGNQTIDKASVLIKTSPSHGSLSQNTDTGEVTYTPNLDYTGNDSFTYTIQDDYTLVSNEATVSITVTPVNDPPVAICQSGVTIYLDTDGNYTLKPSEIDDGSNDDSDNGTVSLSVSPSTFNCSDKETVDVTLTVTDANGEFDTCTTTVTVDASNLVADLTGPNQSCEGEEATFTANGTTGNSGCTYKFYVNSVEQSSGVSGNTFITTSLKNEDLVKVEVTYSSGCMVESNEIIMTIYAKPNPIGIFFTD